jgi:predicted transcriptional regulator
MFLRSEPSFSSGYVLAWLLVCKNGCVDRSARLAAKVCLLDIICSYWTILCYIARMENAMPDDGRVVTAKLPDDLVSHMDRVAERIDRTKSWIVRQAVSEWLAEEQRRYELTLEALKDVNEGRTMLVEEVLAMVERRKIERREARSRSAA